MAGKRTMKLATRGKRFGAACIDAGIFSVLYIILMVAIAAAAPKKDYTSYGYGFENGYGFEYGYGYQQTQNTGAIVMIAVIGLLMLAFMIVEFVFYAKSKSIGKTILGLQVVSSSDGNPIGFWKMLFREVIVKQASSVFLLGYIWILIDDKNRGWHDKILDTYVVDVKESAKIADPVQPAATVSPAAPSAPAAPSPAPQPAPAKEPVHAVPSAPSEDQPASVAQSLAAKPASGPAKEETPEVSVEVQAAAKETVTAIPKAPTIRLDLDDLPDSKPAGEVKADMSMKKDELLATANELGVNIGSKATKAEIIEAISKAQR